MKEAVARLSSKSNRQLVKIALVVTAMTAVTTTPSTSAETTIEPSLGNQSRILETLASGIVRSVNRNETETLLASLQINGLGQLLKEIFVKEDIRHVLPKPIAVNQHCYDNIVDFIDSLIGELVNPISRQYDTKEWAFRMMDAFGKPLPGLYRGTLQWMGSYKECLNIHAKIAAGSVLGSRPTARTSSSEFDTHYCRVQMTTPDPELLGGPIRLGQFWRERNERPNAVHWGTCFPEACSENDVTAFLQTELEPLVSVEVKNTICFKKHLDLWSDTGAVFAVVLLAVVGGIILVCTILDYLNLNGCLPGRQRSHEISQREAESKYHETSPKENGIAPKNTFVLQEKENGIDTTAVGNGISKESTSPNGIYENVVGSNDDIGKHYENCEMEEIKDSIKTKSDSSLPRHREQRTSLGLMLLQAFSVRHNLSKLTSITKNPKADLLPSIQGIRTISIAWIVYGHTHTIGSTMDPRNYITAHLSDIPELISRFQFFVTLSANLAVDTFFVMSGLLVMMLTLRELRNGRAKGIGFWIMFYVHRLWRLTPVYMVVLLTGTTLYDYIVEGPLKSEPYLMFENCPKQWWTNLLYINNLVYPNNECMFWAWYLAVDMQLFVISPIFILLVHRKYRLGIVVLVITIVLGTAGTFVATFYNPGVIITMTPTNTDYWEYVYRSPWSRVAVFTVGMLAGVVLEDQKDKKLNWSKTKLLSAWLILTAIAVFVVGIPHDQLKDGSYYWSDAVQALYESFSRLFWGVFVAWVIFACQKGKGGAFGRMLSWSGFQFPARLTYTVYLVHPLVITFFLYGGQTTFDLVEPSILYRALGNLIMSFFFAAIFTLMFESPTVALEKILLRRK